MLKREATTVMLSSLPTWHPELPLKLRVVPLSCCCLIAVYVSGFCCWSLRSAKPFFSSVQLCLDLVFFAYFFFMRFIFASFSTSAAVLCILKNFTCIKHPSRRSTNGSRKFYIGWAGQKVLTRGIVMIFYKTESYMYHWAIIYTEPKATILLNYCFFV